MAELANDPAASTAVLLHPVILWNISGIDPDVHHHGLLPAGKKCFSFSVKGAKRRL